MANFTNEYLIVFRPIFRGFLKDVNTPFCTINATDFFSENLRTKSYLLSLKRVLLNTLAFNKDCFELIFVQCDYSLKKFLVNRFVSG